MLAYSTRDVFMKYAAYHFLITGRENSGKGNFLTVHVKLRV